MKILFVHNSLPEYRLSWFVHMSQIENCTFLITNPRLAKKIYNTDAEKYVKGRLNYIMLADGLKGYRQIYKILKQVDQYDFIELPPIDSLGELIKALLLRNKAIKNNVKIGYFWEKWEAPIEKQPLIMRIKNLLIGYAAKLVYKKIDVIFASGTKSREYFLKKGVPADKIQLLPDSSDMPVCTFKDIRKEYGIPQNKKIVLYFGRIIQQKGLDYLIHAMAKLPEETKNKSFLLIVGDGPFKGICESIADKLEVKNIVFIGRVEPHERYSYFNQCDIFVHPGTFFEGRTDVWGLTINEAIQTGKIIISTTAVGSAYDLINEKNGFVVNEGNVDQLSSAINMSIKNEVLAEQARVEDKRLFAIYNSKNMALVYIHFCRMICK